MSIEQHAVENTFDTNGFTRNRSTQKVIEYRSNLNKKILYLMVDVGLTDYVRIVIHPQEVITAFSIPGVEIQELKHHSNMTAFPKKIHTGKDLIPYGQGFNINSLTALGSFLLTFHNL